MIRKTLCIKNHRDYSLTGGTIDSTTGLVSTGVNWGSLYGLTDSGDIEYYTGQTSSNAHIAIIPILLTSIIDDIGYYKPAIENWDIKTQYASGNTVMYNDNSYVCTSGHTSGVDFTQSCWLVTPEIQTVESVVTYTGSTRINEFRRYGKSDTDSDLYNPTWNTGFTQEISTGNGTVNKITGERDKIDGLSNQNLYDYKIWSSLNEESIINYSDINNEYSIVSYNTSGLTSETSILSPLIKLDYLIGVISEPKINVDVFIDRGSNLSCDRHVRLGDVKSLTDLESYGNGYFKIKEV